LIFPQIPNSVWKNPLAIFMVRQLQRDLILSIRRERARGLKFFQIARNLHCSLSSVQKYLKNEITFSQRLKIHKERIARIVNKKNIARAKLAVKAHQIFRTQDLKKILNLKCHIRTMQRLANAAKIRLRRPSTKPTLKSEAKTRRYQWAKSLLKPIFSPEELIFDDEAGFTCRSPPCYRKQLQNAGETKIDNDLPDYHTTIFVCGAIGFNFKSKLVTAIGKVTGAVYKTFLAENLIEPLERLKLTKKTLITDNAPWHTARVVKNFLADCDISVRPLPGYSPDCNPIENFWHLIKARLYYDGKSYETKADLQQAIEKVWNDYPQDEINKLVSSFDHRIFAVIDAQGDSTKY
jgi:transposase/predicted transcriptional regulator